jgi:hypothetical protein
MAQVGQVAISSDIPSALKDFYTGTPEKPEAGLIPRATSEIFPEGLTGAEAYAKRFQPLIEQGLVGAGTIAPMSQFQQGVGTQLAGMTMPDQFALGEQSGQASAAGLQALLGVQAPEFGSAQAQQYMSPYMQNVVDAQQRQAIDAARQAQLGGNLAAARQGTYGGARQALLQGQRESGLRTQLGDIRAQGLQRAYEQAQQQFERDRAAGFQAGRHSTCSIATGLGGLAQIFGGLGTQQLAGELDVLKTQGAFGDLQRSVSQQQMDAQRGALQDQAQYGMTQVGQFSNLLRGIPLSDTTQHYNNAAAIVCKSAYRSWDDGYRTIQSPWWRQIMSIASIGETLENPSVTQIMAAYPTKEIFDDAVKAGKIKPTREVGIVSNIFNRIVQSALSNQAQAQAQTTVLQDNTQPMGLAAAAQQLQQPQPQGQGLDQVPVPQQMFERQGMASGGIVAFQAGGPPPSFAGMYSGLDADLTALAAARKAYMGDAPTESEEERRNRRGKEEALRLIEAGLGIAGGTSESFAANLKGALPAIQGYGTDLATQRKEDRDRLAAERAEKGKVFEGVMGSREKAAQLASAEKIAKMQADKETNMKQFATDAIAAEEAVLGRPLTEAETAKIRSQSNERYVTLTAALNARGLSAQAAVSGAGTRDKAVDVELYDKSVAYADTAVHRPRSSENETYKAKLKQDRENAEKRYYNYLCSRL